MVQNDEASSLVPKSSNSMNKAMVAGVGVGVVGIALLAGGPFVAIILAAMFVGVGKAVSSKDKVDELDYDYTESQDLPSQNKSLELLQEQFKDALSRPVEQKRNNNTTPSKSNTESQKVTDPKSTSTTQVAKTSKKPEKSDNESNKYYNDRLSRFDHIERYTMKYIWESQLKIAKDPNLIKSFEEKIAKLEGKIKWTEITFTKSGNPPITQEEICNEIDKRGFYQNIKEIAKHHVKEQFEQEDHINEFRSKTREAYINYSAKLAYSEVLFEVSIERGSSINAINTQAENKHYYRNEINFNKRFEDLQRSNIEPITNEELRTATDRWSKFKGSSEFKIPAEELERVVDRAIENNTSIISNEQTMQHDPNFQEKTPMSDRSRKLIIMCEASDLIVKAELEMAEEKGMSKRDIRHLERQLVHKKVDKLVEEQKATHTYEPITVEELHTEIDRQAKANDKSLPELASKAKEQEMLERTGQSGKATTNAPEEEKIETRETLTDKNKKNDSLVVGMSRRRCARVSAELAITEARLEIAKENESEPSIIENLEANIAKSKSSLESENETIKQSGQEPVLQRFIDASIERKCKAENLSPELMDRAKELSKDRTESSKLEEKESSPIVGGLDLRKVSERTGEIKSLNSCSIINVKDTTRASPPITIVNSQLLDEGISRS